MVEADAEEVISFQEHCAAHLCEIDIDIRLSFLTEDEVSSSPAQSCSTSESSSFCLGLQIGEAQTLQPTDDLYFEVPDEEDGDSTTAPSYGGFETTSTYATATPSAGESSSYETTALFEGSNNESTSATAAPSTVGFGNTPTGAAAAPSTKGFVEEPPNDRLTLPLECVKRERLLNVEEQRQDQSDSPEVVDVEEQVSSLC